MSQTEPGGGGSNPGCEPTATPPTPSPPEPARQSSGSLPPNTAADQERERRIDYPWHLRAPPAHVPLCHGCLRPGNKGPDVEIDEAHRLMIAPPEGWVLCVICAHERLVAAGIDEGAATARFTGGPFQEIAGRLPAELNADLVEILGRPNFACSSIACAFRTTGLDIPRRAESEQAFVLHWLLTLYLRHGADWRGVAGEQLAEIVSAASVGLPANQEPSDG